MENKIKTGNLSTPLYNSTKREKEKKMKKKQKGNTFSNDHMIFNGVLMSWMISD